MDNIEISKEDSTKDAYIQAVIKLNQLTRENKLTWTTSDPPAVLYGEEGKRRVDVTFETTNNNRKIRLYKMDYKVTPSPIDSLISSPSTWLLGSKGPYWTNKIILDIIDDNGVSLFKFPDVPGLEDLLSSVQYQVADVKGLLNDIMNAS